MDVEPGTAADAETLADLWVDLAAGQRAHGSHVAAEGNREVVREAIARHAVADGLRVARAGGETLGFVMFGPETGRYRQEVDRGVVRNLYVRPERRGEGIGSELLAVAEDALEAAGAEVISLKAMADNEAARRFYERHGYRTHRVELEKRPD